MEELFKVTGIQNIDDRYHGLNFLKGPYSVGYVEAETYREATDIQNLVAKMFKAANALEVIHNIPIKISINQEDV